MPIQTPRPAALNELVQSRLAELSLSYGQVAKRGGLPKATVANLATQPLRQVPRAETLVALAKGLDLPISAIQETVAYCVGLVYVTPPGQSHITRALIDTVGRLSPADQKTVVRVAEGLLATRSPRPTV